MAIRLSNSCLNCENLIDGGLCSKHNTMVSKRYTCDVFQLKSEYKSDRNCSSCKSFKMSSCANPDSASPGMLCGEWAPQANA